MTDFPELYRELTVDMGLSLWDVCRRLRLKPASLASKMYRAGIPVPSALHSMSTDVYENDHLRVHAK